MKIVRMQEYHIADVERMARKFYYSDAVCHEIPWENIQNTIETAVSGLDILHGYVFEVDDEIAGFGLITRYFESECGGICVQIMDLYVEEKFRGRKIATKYFEFIFNEYSYAKRFRLEAVEDNPAVELYRKMGFKKLEYMQMIKE